VRPVGDMLDQWSSDSAAVDMVLPSVLAVVELMTPQQYNSLVRRDMRRLFNDATSPQVIHYTSYQSLNTNNCNDVDRLFAKTGCVETK